MAMQFAAGIGREGVHQIRLEIDPRLLPGVQVVMQVFSGQVQLEFICGNEQSRRRLRAVAQREVGSMADRLGRAVEVSLRGVDSSEAGNWTDGHPEFMHAGA
jgi:hypothetical protein